MARLHPAAPGVAVTLAVGVGALLLGRLWGPVSPLLVAILLGVVVANTLTLPESLAPGVAVSAKRLLRVGIVLLGIQLSVRDVTGLGWQVVLLVVAVVGLGILATLGWGRLLGVPLIQSLLIACGFSICGAAAVAAVDGVVDADEEDVATGIALVVVFGAVMIPLAPALGSLLGFSTVGRGVFTGASTHEVAQVVAAGGLIGGAGLATAVLVKLARVLMLAPVMLGVSVWQRRRVAAGTVKRPPVMPLFVAGFVAAVAVRTAGVLPQVSLEVASVLQTWLLAAAMFALGVGVRVSVLRTVGLRPVALGLLSTATLVTIAGVGVWLIG